MREATPAGPWSTLTLLGAMTGKGLWAAMTVASPTDGDVFLAYLDQVRCPRLEPGQIVILDHRGAHPGEGVRERIEAVSAQLLYLPPYSPDGNPIEPAGSKIQPHLRKAKARTWELLQEAVTEALASVTPQDATGWFRHCGYTVH